MDLAPPSVGVGDGISNLSGGDSPPPLRAEIEAALGRMLDSRGFASAPRLQAMLRYIVNATLEKQTDRLKEYAIAVDVFGRPEGFDPRLDSIVRTQASRLRKQIALYYEREGAKEAVRIEAPPGSYQAVFSRRTPEASPRPTHAAIEPEEPPASEAFEVKRLGEAPRPLENKQRGAPVSRPWFMAAVLGVATAVLGALVAATWMSRQHAATDAAVARPSGPAIFVSRFELIDGPGGHGRELRDGLQFELIDRLHEFPELSILGVDTVYGEEQAAASANPHGADFILGGSVQSAEQSLRVTARLTQTSNNTIVWTQGFSGELKDAAGVLALQSEIAGSVASALGQPYGVIQEKLTLDLSAARRMSLEDYLCVLSAYDYSRAKTEAQHLKVRACLEDVTDRSPGYAPAWAKLSWMYGDEARFGFNQRLNDAPPFVRAKEAAEKAVAADASAAMAHQYLAIALFHLGEDDEFRREADKALELNPNNSEILADVGRNLILLDASQRGLEMSQKAIALNPGHPAWYYAGEAVYYLLHHDRRQALDNALNFAPDGSPMAAYVLAAAYRLNGDTENARRTLKDLSDRLPTAAKDRQMLPKTLRFPPELARMVFGG
jgi:adenylate cyclase